VRECLAKKLNTNSAVSKQRAGILYAVTNGPSIAETSMHLSLPGMHSFVIVILYFPFLTT
jgi:hypothetical protein